MLILPLVRLTMLPWRNRFNSLSLANKSDKQTISFFTAITSFTRPESQFCWNSEIVSNNELNHAKQFSLENRHLTSVRRRMRSKASSFSLHNCLSKRVFSTWALILFTALMTVFKERLKVRLDWMRSEGWRSSPTFASGPLRHSRRLPTFASGC